MKTPNAASMAKVVALLESQLGVVDFEGLLKLWAGEVQPDLVPAIERFIQDSKSGENSASAMLLLMALSFEAGRMAELGIIYLESVAKWPKRMSIPQKQ